MLARDAGAEGGGGGVGAVPVALGDGGAADPDLADLAVRARLVHVRVDDLDALLGRHGTAGHDLPGRAGALGRRVRAKTAADGSGADQQGAFGKAVAGQEGLGAEAGVGEGLGEAGQAPRADRLGAVEGHAPGAEVQFGALLGGDAVDAQVEGEVGAAGDGGALVADQAQPAHGVAGEAAGREQGHPAAGAHGGHDRADQAHVVVHRQPGHAAHVLVEFEALRDERGVGEEVLVGEHHPARGGGGTGGVLEEGDGVAGQLRLDEAGGGVGGDLVGDLVGGEQAQPVQAGHGGGPRRWSARCRRRCRPGSRRGGRSSACAGSAGRRAPRAPRRRGSRRRWPRSPGPPGTAAPRSSRRAPWPAARPRWRGSGGPARRSSAGPARRRSRGGR